MIDKLRLSGHETVLDIGCGDGKITAEIARRVPHGRVIGVDNSKEMIGLSRASFPPSDYQNLSFLHGDAQTLEFRHEFEIAFSNATLHWVKNHAQVLAGVAQSLKAGGKILFQMGGQGNGIEIFKVANHMTGLEKWKSWFNGFEFPWNFFNVEEYRSLCAEAGFKVQRLELLPRTMIQNGVDGLNGWIRTTWMPYTQRVPTDLREVFVQEAIELYLQKHPPDALGNIAVHMVRLEVEAFRD
jgi:trans-aconitate methyltransferase